MCVVFDSHARHWSVNQVSIGGEYYIEFLVSETLNWLFHWDFQYIQTWHMKFVIH